MDEDITVIAFKQVDATIEWLSRNRESIADDVAREMRLALPRVMLRAVRWQTRTNGANPQRRKALSKALLDD